MGHVEPCIGIIMDEGDFVEEHREVD